MGKITVKHFLNKRLSSFDYGRDGGNFYTLYVQITVNRKTTQIKSYLDYRMTEKGFDLYVDGIEDWDEQKFGAKQFNSLREEREFIERCINYIETTTRQKYDLGERNIRDDINSLIKPAVEYLSKGSHNARSQKLTEPLDNDKLKIKVLAIQWVLNMIDRNTPLWQIRSHIQTAFDVDITQYFAPHYLAFWEILDELRTITDLNKKYIYWFTEDYIKLDKHPKISIINELIQLSNWGIE